MAGVGETRYVDTHLDPNGQPAGRVYRGVDITDFVEQKNAEWSKSQASMYFGKQAVLAWHSKNGGPYDIKTGFTSHFNSYLFNGRYATAKEMGNFLFGMNIATAGLSYDSVLGYAGGYQTSGVRGMVGHMFGYTYGSAPYYGEAEYSGRSIQDGFNYASRPK